MAIEKLAMSFNRTVPILTLHASGQFVGDFLSDGERRRGAGAWSIQHMQRSIAFDKAKILQRLAIGRDGLRSNAGASWY
jgi:hypothetical protein